MKCYRCKHELPQDAKPFKSCNTCRQKLKIYRQKQIAKQLRILHILLTHHTTR